MLKLIHFIRINFNKNSHFNDCNYLFISNPPDVDLLRSKNIVVMYNRNKLILSLLSVLFYCQVSVVWTAAIYRDSITQQDTNNKDLFPYLLMVYVTTLSVG
jgi:hypothetical protein